MGRKVVGGRPFPPLSAKNIHGRDARYQEISEAGIHEVVVFHSSDTELLPCQGRFPFDVIGDPAKALYKQYGVESSISAFLSLKAWAAALKGNLRRNKPEMKGMPNGGAMGRPAEFLVSADGVVSAAHYGAHAHDQWRVDELLELSRSSTSV